MMKADDPFTADLSVASLGEGAVTRANVAEAVVAGVSVAAESSGSPYWVVLLPLMCLRRRSG